MGNMSDTKMLQALLDGQAAIRKDISTVSGDVNGVKEELKQTEKRLTARLDKLGLQIARLEDDSPTIEEFDALEGRVAKLETQASKN